MKHQSASGSSNRRQRRQGRSAIALVITLFALVVAHLPPATVRAQPPGPDTSTPALSAPQQPDIPDASTNLWMPLVGNLSGPTPATARIEFTSDQTVTLTSVGETGELRAVVYGADGEIDPEAKVTWSSSDPSVVSVSPKGIVTAHAALGSATITAGYQDLQPEVATVVVAELAPNARLIESELVLLADVSQTRIVLVQGPETSALQAGQVIMSGDKGGVLARILAVASGDNQVILDTEPATLTDVFKELRLEARGPPVELDTTISENGLLARNAHGELVLQSIADAQKWRTLCKAEGKTASIDFTGASVESVLSLQPKVVLEISGFSVKKMDLFMEAVMRVTATTGQIKLNAAVSGKIVCEYKFSPIPIVMIPLVGPLSVGGALTFSLGIELEAAFTVGTLSFSGPKLDYGIRVRAGLGYEAVAGFDLINEYDSIGDGLSYPAASGTFDREFTAKVEPFIALTASLNVFFARWSLASFEFLQGKVFGGGELKMRLPDFVEMASYRGPRWELYIGAAVGLEPLGDYLKPLNQTLHRMGLPVLSDGMLDLSLFKVKHVLWHAPEPSVTASPMVVNIDEMMTLTMTAPAKDKFIPLIGAGREVRFLAFKQDSAEEPVLIATGQLDTEGNATGKWTPNAAQEGTYEVTALIYDGIFGHSSVGLPYGSEPGNRVTIEVLGDDIAVIPTLFNMSTQVRQTLVGSFTIYNPKHRKIHYETTAGGGGPLKVTANPSGVLMAETDMRVSFEATCPDEPGKHELFIALLFQEEDGTIISDAPGLVTVNLECLALPDPGQGSLSSSHGDPHLRTPDAYFYDFQAVGDYILAKSTDPGDDFEIQIRYRRPEPGDPWQGNFSFNYAAAMMVNGDRVEIYSTETGVPDIYVNGDLLDASGGLQAPLPGGGSLFHAGAKTTITWPDHTWIRLDTQGWLGREMDRLFIAVELFFSGWRRGNVEGLLGNFDGNASNDIQLRDGEVLTNPTPGQIHSSFRDSWRVPLTSEESLFSLGPDLYAAGYPPNLFSIDDFTPEEVAFAREECLARGIVTLKTLETCIYDVALTGDPNWADVALGVDPNLPRVTMSPGFGFSHPGGALELGAFVAGVAERTLDWSASDGTIIPGGSYTVTYAAPFAAGNYVITATLAADASLFDVATIAVIEDGKSYWTGRGDGTSWHDPENWSFNMLPGPADEVIIDVPGNVTIVHSLGNTSIAHLTSKENLVLSGGTLSIAEQAVLDNSFTISGGMLGGAGEVVVNGLLTWSGGSMAGGGKTVLKGETNLSGSNTKALEDRILENASTIVWTGSGLITTRAGTVINNLAGATFDVQTDANLDPANGFVGNIGIFNNMGTLQKTGGDGTSTWRVCFNNNGGVIDAQSGTLDIQDQQCP